MPEQSTSVIWVWIFLDTVCRSLNVSRTFFLFILMRFSDEIDWRRKIIVKIHLHYYTAKLLKIASDRILLITKIEKQYVISHCECMRSLCRPVRALRTQKILSKFVVLIDNRAEACKLRVQLKSFDTAHTKKTHTQRHR